MPPKSKLSKIAGDIAKAKKEQRAQLSKVQKGAVKKYPVQMPRNMQNVINKAENQEAQKDLDLIFFRELGTKNPEDQEDELLKYIDNNPRQKIIIKDILSNLPPEAILKFAREYSKTGELLSEYWATYKKRTNIKEIIFAKKQLDDEVHEMREALGEEQLGKRDDDDAFKMKDVVKRRRPINYVEHRVVYGCKEEMRRAPWVDNVLVRDAWLSASDESDLNDLYVFSGLFADPVTMNYEGKTWYKAGKNYYKILCDSGVTLEWNNKKMTINGYKPDKTLKLRILYQSDDGFIRQNRKIFDKMQEFRSVIMTDKNCVENKGLAKWVKQGPVVSILLSPIDSKEEISRYIDTNVKPVKEYDYEWYPSNRNFLRLLCSKFSDKNTQENDIYTAYTSNDVSIQLRVAYKLKNGTLLVQDEKVFQDYVKYNDTISQDQNNPCIQAWKKAPWMRPEHVRAIYVKITNKTTGKDEWITPGKKFFETLCDDNTPLAQHGNKLHINPPHGRVIELWYKTQKDFIVQNEEIYEKMTRYMINQKETQEELAEKILGQSVDTRVKNQAISDLAAVFQVIAPSQLDYTGDSPKFIEEIVDTFNSETLADFLSDYADLAIFLEKPLINVGNGVFLNRIREKYYTPNTLAKLTVQEKLPEIFGNSGYPHDKQELLLKTIETAKTRFSKDFITGIIESENPTKRKPTRPTLAVARSPQIHDSLTCINSTDMSKLDRKKVIYYKDSATDQLYCFSIEKVAQAISDAEVSENPVRIDVDIGGKITVVTLDNEYIQKFRELFKNELVEEKTKIQEDEKLDKKFEKQITEQDVDLDNELAPGLIDLIKNGILDLEQAKQEDKQETSSDETSSDESSSEEDESETADEDEDTIEMEPRQEKTSDDTDESSDSDSDTEKEQDADDESSDSETEKVKDKCWYCSKIIKNEGEFKTIIFRNGKPVTAHFCSKYCLENQQKWPRPNLPKKKQKKPPQVQKPSDKQEKTPPQAQKQDDEEETSSEEEQIFENREEIAAGWKAYQGTKKYRVGRQKQQVPKPPPKNATPAFDPEKIAQEIYNQLDQENILNMKQAKNYRRYNEILGGKIPVPENDDRYDNIKDSISRAFVAIRARIRGLTKAENAAGAAEKMRQEAYAKQVQAKPEKLSEKAAEKREIENILRDLEKADEILLDEEKKKGRRYKPT